MKDIASNRAARIRLAKALASVTAFSALCTAFPGVSFGADVSDTAAIAMTRPKSLVVAEGMGAGQLARIERPVKAFYGFWVNGSASLLAEAVSSSFVDHTLPPGRPQGPTGPAIAYSAFSKAVPDLHVEVVQRIIVKDRVVSHLRFTGHFLGVFANSRGRGQKVDFIATDILRVSGGRITDNWHLEDNLTFLKQVGQVK